MKKEFIYILALLHVTSMAVLIGLMVNMINQQRIIDQNMQILAMSSSHLNLQVTREEMEKTGQVQKEQFEKVRQSLQDAQR